MNFCMNSRMNVRRYQLTIVPLMMLLLATFVACAQKQSPQEIKEKTAEATAEVKSDAKAVAEGIREGLDRDQSRIDLNSASKAQLLTLPGVTAAEADRVIAGRPYSEPDDVVRRRIMSRAEYDKIAGKVTAKN